MDRSVILSKHSFIYANIATKCIRVYLSKTHLKSQHINKFN